MLSASRLSLATAITLTEPLQRLRQFGSDLESAVTRGRVEHLAGRVMARVGGHNPRRSARAALAGVSFLLLFGSLTGVLANDAAPGQLLYGLDRAAEKVGLGRGDARERLQEALRLVERGDNDGALLIAAEAVNSMRPDLTIQPSVKEPMIDNIDPDVLADTQEASRVIKLAVEALLRSLDAEDGSVDSALSGLVAVIAPPGPGAEGGVVTSSTSSTSTTSTSTTSTSTTTTSSTSTTSSTEPEQSTTTTTTGGIILPPIP